jgi:hypothetical protein
VLNDVGNRLPKFDGGSTTGPVHAVEYRTESTLSNPVDDGPLPAELPTVVSLDEQTGADATIVLPLSVKGRPGSNADRAAKR